jgi:hypothetical protein
MAFRRAWLVAGAVGLVASAARAGVEGSGEINGYGGTASGNWACGPAARVQYGGLGGRARLHVHSTHPAASATVEVDRARPTGFSIGGGGAWESRKGYAVLQCYSDSESPKPDCIVPPSSTLSAIGGSIGYDLETMGVRLGVLHFGSFHGNHDLSPTYQFFPDISVWGGWRSGLHASGGLGSYDASTMLRPGLWWGFGVPIVPDTLAIYGHLGVHQNFDGDLGLRLHAQIAVSLGAGLEALAGGAVTQGYRSHPEPEGSLTLRFNGGGL